jgi:putative spermidine/putrescine transport system substrate-binding protein
MNVLKKRTNLSVVGATATLAVVLVGCVGGDSESVVGGDSESVVGGDSKSITFNATGGFMSESLVTAVVEPFTAETGIEVVMTAPNDLAKMRIMVESGNVDWDVVTADPSFSILYCDEYVEKLDFDIIDTSNLDPSLVSDCTVPMITPAYILIYNTETYGDNPPTSWADFFDVEKFPGSRGMADWVDAGMLEAAMASSGASDPSQIDLDVALRELDKIKDDAVFWGSGAEMQESFENNRIDMAIGFMARAWTAMDQGSTYDIVWNEAIYFYDALMVVKGSKNKDAAMEFINFALQEGPQSKLTELTVYPGANLKSQPQLTGVQTKFAPQEREKAIMRDYNWWTTNLDEATEEWTTWKVG